MDYVKDFGEHNLMYDDHFDQSYLDTSVQKSVLINHSSYAQLYVTYPTCTFNLFLYPDNIFYIYTNATTKSQDIYFYVCALYKPKIGGFR